MAKTKAQLIVDAETAGITLTGSETAAEILAKLNAAGDDTGETVVEAGDTPVEAKEPTPEEAALAEAAAKVADAKKVLDEAAATHKAAVDEEAAAAEVLRVKPEVGKHVILEDSGTVEVADAYDSMGNKQRSFVYAGSNYEHTAEGENGVWVYRKM